MSLQIDSIMFATCPACRLDFQAVPLFALQEVPVQSVRLVPDTESARSFTRGALTLFDCPGCGLVFNRDFQPQSQHWDPNYEETQACSGHFNKFAQELAEQLTLRYGLNKKRILEVGCGKGHFLAWLCRDGRNTGLGVDPAFDPTRNPGFDTNVTYLQEALDLSHLEFEPDLIVCRHTLEHISSPGGMLELFASRSGCDVFVEVPDLGLILAEGAFWDIYYEHCSYYNSQSLALTLNRFGVECLQTSLCFHDQYLLAWGRAGNPQGELVRPGRPLLSGHNLRQSVSAWCQQLSQWRAAKESVVLWGGGSKAVAFLSGIGSLAATIYAAIDINPRKQGHFLPGTGHAVLSPEDLTVSPPDHIVILNPGYRGEIAALVSKLGIRSNLVDVNQIPSQATVL